MEAYVFTINKADQHHIYTHLQRCKDLFIPPLHSRVDIKEYAGKLTVAAERFEAWHAKELIGMVAAYMNDRATKKAFITNVSVEAGHQGIGIAGRLLKNCMECAKKNGFNSIELEVSEKNLAVIQLYHKVGFTASGKTTPGFYKFALQLHDK